jgi:hypothetical protein
MATSSDGSTTDSTDPQPAEQLKAALTSADSNVTQGLQTLQSVHQARLAQASRTVAVLKAQFGADDPRVKTAEAAVTVRTTTIARISMARQQLAVPSVQVAPAGWALQGRVLDAQMQPVARFTVFLVDANKDFLQEYGFAYTDSTGYFLLNYQGNADPTAAPQLFLEVVDTQANPVYLSSTQFVPVLGTASFQNVVLQAGGQPIGDPTAAIRAVAMPGKDAKPKQATTSPTPSRAKMRRTRSSTHSEGHPKRSEP